MSAPPCPDPEVFEQEKNRVGGNREAYFAKHTDLRGIPGLVFTGSPGEPVAHGGWDAFGLFFDGVTVTSHENKLKVAHDARNWFQLMYIWVGRLDATTPINRQFLMVFRNDYARRHDNDPQLCCSEDMFVVMAIFLEARKEAICRLVDPTGFERLHYFGDRCNRDTSDRRIIVPPHIHQIIRRMEHPIISDFV